MSSFDVCVHPLVISPHPNADRLELAAVGGFQSVVAKGQFQTGDLAIYIPEQAIVPEPILREMNLWDHDKNQGKLAGSKGNRLKAVRLRSVLSQGLVWAPSPQGVGSHVLPLRIEDGDLAEDLGIVKWEPPVPTQLGGIVEAGRIRGYTDLENVKKFPDALIDNEQVVITEKLHGTCALFGFRQGTFNVSSKGLASKGLVLVNEPQNTYWRVANDLAIKGALESISADHGGVEVTLYGEILGVQDLMYGMSDGAVTFRAFDLRIDDEFVSYPQLFEHLEPFGIDLVPILYEGPYSHEVLLEHTSGTSTIADHIREGVVVRTVPERRDRIGRMIMKSISDDYLSRHNATEYN